MAGGAVEACISAGIDPSAIPIVGINAGLIAFGVAGVFMPATSALLHNISTLVISLQDMRNLLDDAE